MAPEDAWEEQCKDLFHSFDLDGNGRITPYIIGQVMKKQGWTVQPFELVVKSLIISIQKTKFCDFNISFE